MTNCMSHILINTSCRRYVILFKTLFITSQTLLIFASFYRLWHVSFIEDLTIPYMIGYVIESTSYLGHPSHRKSSPIPLFILSSPEPLPVPVP